MTSFDRQLFPVAADPRALRVLVVGAGVIGMSVAHALVARGRSKAPGAGPGGPGATIQVAVIDARQLGRGASWAAAGMLAPTLEYAEAVVASQTSHTAPPDAATTSDEATRRARLRDVGLQSVRLWPGLARTLERESGRAVGLRREGALGVAATKTELDALAAAACAPSGQGRESDAVRVLSARAVRTLAPTLGPGLAGGVFAPHDIQVDARAVVEALAASLARAGVVVRGGVALTHLEPGAPVRVMLRSGDQEELVQVDELVMALGAGISHQAGISREVGGDAPASALGLTDQLLEHITPVKGQMLALDGSSVGLSHVVRSSYRAGGGRVYLVPKDDGRILVGASVEPGRADALVETDTIHALMDQATRLAPALASAPVLSQWAGVRPMARADTLMVGRTAPGVTVGMGHHRSGFLLAPITAQSLAGLVLDGEEDAGLHGFAPPRLDAPATDLTPR